MIHAGEMLALPGVHHGGLAGSKRRRAGGSTGDPRGRHLTHGTIPKKIGTSTQTAGGGWQLRPPPAFFGGFDT